MRNVVSHWSPGSAPELLERRLLFGADGSGYPMVMKIAEVPSLIVAASLAAWSLSLLGPADAGADDALAIAWDAARSLSLERMESLGRGVDAESAARAAESRRVLPGVSSRRLARRVFALRGDRLLLEGSGRYCRATGYKIEARTRLVLTVRCTEEKPEF